MQAKPQALLTYPNNEQAKQAYQEFIAKHYQGFPEYQADEATQAWLLQEFEQAKQAQEQAEQAQAELDKLQAPPSLLLCLAFGIALACACAWLGLLAVTLYQAWACPSCLWSAW